jgi:hypothetical protein
LKKLEGTIWKFKIINEDFVQVNKGNNRVNRKIIANEFQVGKNVYNLNGKIIKKVKRRGDNVEKSNVS